MNKLAPELFGSTSTPSVNLVENVLNQKCIENIRIVCNKNIFSDNFCFYGIVSFKNNGTSLQQEFKGNSLSDVFIKVQKFCMNLP